MSHNFFKVKEIVLAFRKKDLKIKKIKFLLKLKVKPNVHCYLSNFINFYLMNLVPTLIPVNVSQRKKKAWPLEHFRANSWNP